MKKIHTNTYKKRFGKRLLATAALSAVMFQNVFATSILTTPSGSAGNWTSIPIDSVFTMDISSLTPGDTVVFDYQDFGPAYVTCSVANGTMQYVIQGGDTAQDIGNYLVPIINTCLVNQLYGDAVASSTPTGFQIALSATNGENGGTPEFSYDIIPGGGGGDVTPPSLTVPGNFTTSLTGGTLSGTVSDGESGVSAVNIEITDPLAAVNTYSGNVVGGNWDYNYSLSSGTGTYNVLVTAVNGSGLTTTGSHTITLTEPDLTAPVVTLSGAATMNHELGTTFVDAGADWTDNLDGSGHINVATSGSVNSSATGVYTLEYTYTDAASNTGNVVSRTVTVVDTTAPTITLSGSSPMSIEVGTPFVDPGATYSDADGSNGAAAVTGTVDTALTGSYVLTYSASDITGNSGTLTRTVNVVDTTAPVVTLSGAATMNVNVGTGNYVEQGATWTDNLDGSGAATISGTVNDTVTGTYLVQYSHTDVSGNTSAVVTRTVNVIDPDLTAPVVTLSGAATMNHELGTTFVDAGADWTDNLDGSGHINVATSGSVNSSATGVYTLEYTYTDAASNTGNVVSRTVTVVDTTAPTITLSGSSPMSIEVGTPFVDPGATYSDADGSNGAAAVTGTVDTALTGSYVLTYSASDITGNSGTLTRTVNVVDTTAPVVTLSGAATMNVNVGTGNYVEQGATWTDNLDGSGAATISGTVNDTVTGTYLVQYSHTDVSGNTSAVVTRTVNVIDPDLTAPVVTLSGAATMNHELGTTFVDAGADWTDNLDGSGHINVATSGSVNSSATGVYTLEYTYTDAASNTGNVVSRTVTVVDTTAPTITLSGSSPMSIEVGTPFVDPGATYSDADGSNGAAAVTGTVDTALTGSYVLTYSASDITGNSGTLTRTVNVVDTTAPVVTLSGAATMNVNVGTGNYVEQGATWTDNLDGSGAATISGTVNDTVTGTYLVEYSHTDVSGNASTVVTRTVNVIDPDLTAPTFTENSALSTNTTSTSYAFSGTVNDPENSYPLTIEYSVNKNALPIGTGSAVVATGNTWSEVYTFANGTGTYSFSFSAKDNLGNISSVITRDVTYSLPVATGATQIAATPVTGTGNVNLSASGASGSTFQTQNAVTITATTSGNTLKVGTGTVFQVSGTDWDGVLTIAQVASGAAAQATLAKLPVVVSSGVTYTVHDTIEAGASGGTSLLVTSGALFDMKILVPNVTIGTMLGVYRSSTGGIWSVNTPQANCSVDSSNYCNFQTDHLSYFATMSTGATSGGSSGSSGGSSGGSSETPAINAAGGGHGVSLKSISGDVTTVTPSKPRLTEMVSYGDTEYTTVLDEREVITLSVSKFQDGEKVRVFIKDENGSTKQIAYVTVKNGTIKFQSKYTGKFLLKNFKPNMNVGQAFFDAGAQSSMVQ